MLDTIAWGLKFDLLQLQRPPTIDGTKMPRLLGDVAEEITFATTCMGRLAHLQQTLPRMVAQPGCHVVLADYSCPDQSGRWAQQNFSADDVTVVHVSDRKRFDRSEAKNAAVSVARSTWVCLIDADVLIAEDFAEQIRHRLFPQRYLRCISRTEGVGGTIIASREALHQSGLHDPVYRDWGEEDNDLLDALLFIGQQAGVFPEELVTHLAHDDSLRTQYHETADRRVSHLANRVYRAMKWDAAKINGEVPALETRQAMYEQIQHQVSQAVKDRASSEIVVPLGERHWKRLSASGARALRYRVDIDADF